MYASGPSNTAFASTRVSASPLPSDAVNERSQGLFLPLAPAGGGFDDAVLEAGEKIGTMVAEPGEYVRGQTAIVCAGFDELGLVSAF